MVVQSIQAPPQIILPLPRMICMAVVATQYCPCECIIDRRPRCWVLLHQHILNSHLLATVSTTKWERATST